MRIFLSGVFFLRNTLNIIYNWHLHSLPISIELSHTQTNFSALNLTTDTEGKNFRMLFSLRSWMTLLHSKRKLNTRSSLKSLCQFLEENSQVTLPASRGPEWKTGRREHQSCVALSLGGIPPTAQHSVGLGYLYSVSPLKCIFTFGKLPWASQTTFSRNRFWNGCMSILQCHLVLCFEVFSVWRTGLWRWLHRFCLVGSQWLFCPIHSEAYLLLRLYNPVLYSRTSTYPCKYFGECQGGGTHCIPNMCKIGTGWSWLSGHPELYIKTLEVRKHLEN